MNTEIKKEVQLTLDKNENDVIEDNEFAKVKTPPIKCQGIKTKIIPHIIENLDWSGGGRWIEPFLGSGVVLFNIKPDRALVNDINPHIINFITQFLSIK